MNPEIRAIFLDVGHTLRVVVKDELFAAQARRQLATLVCAQESPEEFLDKLLVRWKDYRKWSFEHLTEASEMELWTRWLLPDFPAEQIGPRAGKLTRLWRDKDGRRVPRHDVKATVMELDRRGYRLGIIANTITETEIPDWLVREQLGKYFKAVILSSRVRYRKPGPEIYWEATRCLGVSPAHSAYVGDNPVRDVEGTRRAGFGLSIILIDENDPPKDPIDIANRPDYVIHECGELLDIFPPNPVNL